MHLSAGCVCEIATLTCITSRHVTHSQIMQDKFALRLSWQIIIAAVIWAILASITLDWPRSRLSLCCGVLDYHSPTIVLLQGDSDGYIMA